eukprot:11173327-Lingulodinium_polyedra.AAC.1
MSVAYAIHVVFSQRALVLAPGPQIDACICVQRVCQQGPEVGESGHDMAICVPCPRALALWLNCSAAEAAVAL